MRGSIDTWMESILCLYSQAADNSSRSRYGGDGLMDDGSRRFEFESESARVTKPMEVKGVGGGLFAMAHHH
jgi:hypothetical protein